MTSRNIESTVLANDQVSNDIYKITLDAPSVTEASHPGQFVMIKASEENGAPLLRRPFSIHQASADGWVQILFKRIGPGTTFLSNRNKGDKVSMIGPLGKGFSTPTLLDRICIIGGGMGVAPLFYLTKQLIETSPRDRKIMVLLGSATADEINVLESEFRKIGAEVIVSTDDGSSGHHGLVTDLLLSKLDQNEKWSVLSCGPYPMLRAVAQFCKNKNWPCQVSMETLMACGISACLGCAIRGSAQSNKTQEPYLHVCKDGPVFDANELEWI